MGHRRWYSIKLILHLFCSGVGAMELVAMDMKVSVGEIFIGGKNFVANLGAL